MVYHSSRIKLSTGQLFWREAGNRQNPVLIFLHGSWHDSRQWQEIMEPLSKHYHCFAIDLLGYGNSVGTKPPNSIAIEVDCLAEFIDTLKLNSVYLVGHSLGAWVAISYALKFPDIVRGVVAISPEGFSLNNWRSYGKLTKFILAHPSFFRTWLFGVKILYSLSDGANSLQQAMQYWQLFRQFPTTCRILFGRSNKAVSTELVADRLANFRSPLAIIQDDRDDPKIVNQSKSYVQFVRKSEYHSISDISTQQIVVTIESFINRVETQIDREEVELW